MTIALLHRHYITSKSHLPQVGRAPDVSSDNFDWRQVHSITKRNICLASFKLRVTKMDTFARSQLNCPPCVPAQAWSFHDLCFGSNPGRMRTNALAWVNIHTEIYHTSDFRLACMQKRSQACSLNWGLSCAAQTLNASTWNRRPFRWSPLRLS